MLLLSLLFVFIFQPVLPIRGLDFSFPLWTILLTLGVYGAFSNLNSLRSRQNIIDTLIITGSLLLISLTRFISYDGIITASRPPQLQKILPVILIGAGAAFLLNDLTCKGKKWPKQFLVTLILAILVILKTPALAMLFSRTARSLNGQATDTALSTDIRWFGFSYIAFRLLSILIDSLKGRKADLCLGDFLIYVCFPPALSAGPIDRWDRFSKEFTAGSKNTTGEDFTAGCGQIALGLFHKFILADSLAKMALSAQNARQFIHSGWAWAALFAYALQIYFDFSGYSDMAIGIGRCLGFHFNENFNHPYCCNSVTDFWRRWHISLGSFFRDYVYIPMGGNRKMQWRNVLCVWFLTGMWHGASWNFIIWGLFFGVILVIEKLFILKKIKDIPVVGNVYSLLMVYIGWGIFYFTDFANMKLFFSRIFTSGEFYNFADVQAITSNLWLWVAAIALCMPLRKVLEQKITKPEFNCAYRITISVLVILFSTALLVGATNNAFLYFRF